MRALRRGDSEILSSQTQYLRQNFNSIAHCIWQSLRTPSKDCYEASVGTVTSETAELYTAIVISNFFSGLGMALSYIGVDVGH